MFLRDKKHMVFLFILIIMLFLYTPLSYINAEKHVSFKTTFPKEEMFILQSMVQHFSSEYSSKKHLFTLKPVLKHIRFLLNSVLIIECFICAIFIRSAINKRRLIYEHCIVRFHGSKYKSLPLSF